MSTPLGPLDSHAPHFEGQPQLSLVNVGGPRWLRFRRRGQPWPGRCGGLLDTAGFTRCWADRPDRGRVNADSYQTGARVARRSRRLARRRGARRSRGSAASPATHAGCEGPPYDVPGPSVRRIMSRTLCGITTLLVDLFFEQLSCAPKKLFRSADTVYRVLGQDSFADVVGPEYCVA